MFLVIAFEIAMAGVITAGVILQIGLMVLWIAAVFVGEEPGIFLSRIDNLGEVFWWIACLCIALFFSAGWMMNFWSGFRESDLDGEIPFEDELIRSESRPDDWFGGLEGVAVWTLGGMFLLTITIPSGFRQSAQPSHGRTTRNRSREIRKWQSYRFQAAQSDPSR